MSPFFAARESAIVPCGSGYSFFFDLIARIWAQPDSSTDRPIHRVCSLMRKMGVTCLVEEELRQNQELSEEEDAAGIRCDGKATLAATRFTFFRQYPIPNDWRCLDSNSCLGYMVVITLHLPDGRVRNYILEAVVRSPCLFLPAGEAAETSESVTNYYVHCVRDFTTSVGTEADCREFPIRGSFFCQQNNLTHVCAHAALRMAVNSCPAYGGPKLSVKQINDLLGLHHRSFDDRVGAYQGPNECGNRGLNQDQIAYVAKVLGFNIHAANFVLRPHIDYADYVFPVVESHYPVILGVQRLPAAPASPDIQHVVTILGHTLNTDRWNTEAGWGYGAFPPEYCCASSNWADHFLMSDDNYGMYLTLPTEMIKNFLVPRHNPNLHAAMALALLPAEVTIPGYYAEQAARVIARWLITETEPPFQERWFDCLRRSRFVCRTLLQDRDEYLRWLHAVQDSDGHAVEEQPDAQERVSNALEGCAKMWVTEITLPNLFTGNKHKLADVILPADSSLLESARVAWLPGHLYTGTSMLKRPPPYTQWPLTGHVPLIRGSGSAPRLEW